MDASTVMKMTAALAIAAGLWAAPPALAKGSLNQHTQCGSHDDSVLCPPPYSPAPLRPWKHLHSADDPE